MRGNMRLRVSILLCLSIVMCGLMLFLGSNSSVVHAEGSQGKRVLYISSYSPSFETFFQQIEGIKSQFEPEEIVLDIEFMDSKRFYTPENLENFKRTITYKLKNCNPYDAIIVADDNGLSFVMENQEELFYQIPIVFMGINNIENAQKATENPYITGVLEAPSISDTIGVASKLKPNAKRVVALIDNTPSGKSDLDNFMRVADRHPELKFDYLSLANLSFDEFRVKVGELTEDDILVHLSIFRDKEEETVSFYEGLELLRASTDQPIFHPYFHGLDHGVVGGRVVSHYEQGIKAGSIVLNIFNNKGLDGAHHMYDSPNRYMFDYKLITYYGFDESVLPKDTIFINKEPSFFEENFYFILIGLLIICFELFVIVGLIINTYRRKVAENKLHKNKEDLVEANEELTATNEELSTINEELIAALEEIDIQDKKIYNLVYIDALTGLKNKYAINQFIDNIIHFHNADNGILAVMFLDIDNFKYINDTHGHDVGDQVIEIIGKRLIEYNDEGITIGRFGGDEFLIVINRENMGQVYDLVALIKSVCAKPVIIDQYKFFLTVSIGVATYSDRCKKRKDLVKRADMALYKAKEKGKNTSVVYCEAMNEEVEHKMVLQNAIKEAVKSDEFYLNYQPYLNAETGEVLGIEALIRWQSKDLGFVSPYQLIRNAEEMGLIIEIGEWVLRESCKMIKQMNEKRERPLTISVNISALQLMDKDFYDRTVAIIEEEKVNPSNICLEMTETILIESLEAGTTLINQLMDYGIQIGLDDFGTGYSSLKYFKSLPANVLKIDKSFVDHITSNKYDYHLVNTMVEIAHMKGISVVVEGVETKDQYEILKEIGCDAIQGYLFSKPLGEQDIVQFIEKKD